MEGKTLAASSSSIGRRRRDLFVHVVFQPPFLHQRFFLDRIRSHFERRVWECHRRGVRVLLVLFFPSFLRLRLLLVVVVVVVVVVVLLCARRRGTYS